MARRPTDAFTHGVSLLGQRERSRAKLRALLLSRGYAEADVDAALGRLVKLGYADDARVARFEAGRALEAGRARADAVRRLSAAGLEEALARRAVAEVYDAAGQDEEASARALLARRKLTGAKAARLLLARGFDEALARRLAGLDEG